MEDATNEELIAVENALPGELRQNAAIVWHDEDLGRTYQGALQSGQAVLPVPFLVDHQPDLLGSAPAGAAVLGEHFTGSDGRPPKPSAARAFQLSERSGQK